MPLRFKWNVLTNKLDLVQVADDTAYGDSWDGETQEAPSQNAVYDEVEAVKSDYLKYLWIMAG